MLHTLLTIVQLFSAVCIIVLVLVQRGKGADAGAGFGAGASGTVFGARGATTALSRATAILAAVFMLSSVTLAYTATRAIKDSGPASVLDKLAEQPASTVPAVPANQAATTSTVPAVPANAPEVPPAKQAP
jgi:preprotein translocase subunit SecG